MKTYSIAVVGATGLVGIEMVKILAESEIPIGEVRLFASSKSIGKTFSFKGKNIIVEALKEDSFSDVDFALFSAGTEISLQYAPIATKNDCVVIDNSKAFRMKKSIPLIVPEINAALLQKKPALIANPNCSTIQMVVALKPIYDTFGIEKIVVSTYQAVSGAGKEAVEELAEQSYAVLAQETPKSSVFPYQIAYNCIPQIDVFTENGYSLEEMKLVNETRKIFADETIKINATAVRVPVFNGHCESVYVECKKEVSVSEIRDLMQQASGIKLVDDNTYPMPIQTDDNVLVGRIRQDLDTKHAFSMWIAANNLRKGAALNAVQILEAYINI